MSHTQNPWLLVFAVVAGTFVGFTVDASVEPRPLQAQAACGRFDGKLCTQNCTRECTDGSCCRWDYYYDVKTEVTPVYPGAE